MSPRLDRRFFGAPLAHRGLHDAGSGVIENSRTAIVRAARAGFGIEIDVQIAADGEAVVFHDDTLDRLTDETGPVRNHTAGELRGFRLTGSMDGIDRLSDILSLVDGAVPLLIEIKDQDGALGPRIGALEDAVARAIENYTGPVGVMSFNPHSIAVMERLTPETPRGLVTDPFKAKDWPDIPAKTREDLAKIGLPSDLGISFISHKVNDLDSPEVARLKAGGLDILCWTVRDERTEARARRFADNITFEGYVPSK